MSANLQAADRLLLTARTEGTPDTLAKMLVTHANALLETGNIAQARLELDEAAELYRQQGLTYDEARCTHFAATLYRFSGELEEAKKRAQQALRLADEIFKTPNPIAVSAATELGEIALAQQNGLAAVQSYNQALAIGAEAGLTATASAALLRKRAIAQIMCKRYQDAVTDLDKAHSLLLLDQNSAEALRTLVEKAAALLQGGYMADAEKVISDTFETAKTLQNHHIQADLLLLQTTQAIELKDLKTALAKAKEARDQALQAGAPLSYISATAAIADLAEAHGDHLTAYKELVVGWSTIAEIMGSDIAKTTFEPKLLELHRKWGGEMFTQIKSSYEAKARLQRMQRGDKPKNR